MWPCSAQLVSYLSVFKNMKVTRNKVQTNVRKNYALCTILEQMKNICEILNSVDELHLGPQKFWQSWLADLSLPADLNLKSLTRKEWTVLGNPTTIPAKLCGCFNDNLTPFWDISNHFIEFIWFYISLINVLVIVI